MSPRTNKGKITFHRGFKVPTREQILKSIETGQVNVRHDKSLKKLTEIFSSIRNPTDSLDWLAQFYEPEQSCKEFHQTCPFTSDQIGIDNFIYLVQIESFNQGVDFDQLVEYSKCFFSEKSIKVFNFKIDIKKIETNKNKFGFKLEIECCNIKKNLKFRCDHESGHIQIFTESLLGFLALIKPNDACCLIGLTEWDLYVENSDLFVAGLADGNRGVATFSYFRYNPNLE